MVSFLFLWPKPFVASIVLFLKAYVDPISWWYLIFFSPYFPFCISNNIMSPVTKQATVLNYVLSASGFRKYRTSEVSPPLMYYGNEYHQLTNYQPWDNLHLFYCVPCWTHRLTTLSFTINLNPCPHTTQTQMKNASYNPTLWCERCHK